MFLKHGAPEDIVVVHFCKVCGRLPNECTCEKKPELNTCAAEDAHNDKVETNVHQTSDRGRHH